MNPELSKLKTTLITLKEKQEIVEINTLIKYIDNIDTSNSRLNNDDFLIANQRVQTDVNIAYSNNVNAMSMEMFKSVILSGQSAIKFSMVINGGGAISLLAFIGKIWDNNLAKDLLENLSTAIFIFSIGILLSAIASGITYITQSLFSYEKIKMAWFSNILAILLVISSYITFFMAIKFSLKAFILPT